VKHFALLIGSLLLAVALATGCSSSSLAGSPELDLISQVQDAPNRVQHSGTRRVESYYQLDGSGEALIYREEVQADGQGHFAITPLGAVQGGPSNSAEFIAIQMIRAGFNFRYRDFLVRDLTAFLNNYQLISANQVVQIAGRDCLQVEIIRKDGSARYEVALDVATGLVLRYREFDHQGALYSMMEYESYNAAPDQSQVVFHQSTNQEAPLTSASDLHFVPFTPKLLPDSAFTFLEGTIITEPSTGARFAKLSYTDGVETIFFLDGGPDAAAPTLPTLQVGSSSNYAGLTEGHGDGMGDEVRAFHEGPLTVIWGKVSGHSIYLVGKVTETELLEMLTSALP